MQTGNQKAFTMVELIFVIIIIGILTAIALPKFAETSKLAYISSAKSTIASARAALATERQKSILRGDTDDIDESDAGVNFANFLHLPITSCNSDKCGGWSTSDADYTFHGPTGNVVFTIGSNKITCTSSDTICSEYGE